MLKRDVKCHMIMLYSSGLMETGLILYGTIGNTENNRIIYGRDFQVFLYDEVLY